MTQKKTNVKTTTETSRIDAIEAQLASLLELLTEAKGQAKTEAKTEAKGQAKTEAKTEAKGQAKSKASKGFQVKLVGEKPKGENLDKFALSLDALMTLAVKEAKTSTRVNAKRIALVPYDIRLFITHGTNSAIKAYCRASKGTAEHKAIPVVASELVAMYEKANGKGSASKLWAKFDVEAV